MSCDYCSVDILSSGTVHCRNLVFGAVVGFKSAVSIWIVLHNQKHIRRIYGNKFLALLALNELVVDEQPGWLGPGPAVGCGELDGQSGH